MDLLCFLRVSDVIGLFYHYFAATYDVESGGKSVISFFGSYVTAQKHSAGTASRARRMRVLPPSSAASLFSPKRRASPAAITTHPMRRSSMSPPPLPVVYPAAPLLVKGAQPNRRLMVPRFFCRASPLRRGA